MPLIHIICCLFFSFFGLKVGLDKFAINYLMDDDNYKVSPHAVHETSQNCNNQNNIANNNIINNTNITTFNKNIIINNNYRHSIWHTNETIIKYAIFDIIMF